MEISNKDKLEPIIKQALAETKQRLIDKPGFLLFINIEQQLRYVHQIVFLENRSPTIEERNAISLSSLGRNNFADGNTYGDKLALINTWFNELAAFK